MNAHVDPVYIDKSLKRGHFVEVSSPRPKRLDRPERLKKRHRDIEAEVSIACTLASSPGVIVVPAVDTNDRLMIVQIEQQQAPLRVGPPPSAYELQVSSARVVKDNAAFYLDVVTQLKNGSIRTYGDLVKACGNEQTVAPTLRARRKLKSSSTCVQTIEGVVELHSEKIMQRGLPDDREAVCRIAYRGMEIEKGEIMLHLRLDSVVLQSLSHAAGPAVRRVRLDADNKLRMLKILQGLAFLDADAEVLIGHSFELWTQHWQLTVKGFAEEDLVIKTLGALADMVPS